MRTDFLALMSGHVARHGWWHCCVDLASELWFDVSRGVRTTTPQDTLVADPDAIRYQGAVPRLVRRMLSTLPCRPRDALFLDIGAGKGRVLLLALEAGFTDVVGWEADPSTAASCARNLARAARRVSGRQWQVVRGDARVLELPSRPFVAFLYNPFVGETFRSVAARLAASPDLQAIVYINPVELTVLESMAFSVLDRVDQRGRLLACTLSPPRNCANAASAASRELRRSTTGLRTSWRSRTSTLASSGNQRAR